MHELNPLHDSTTIYDPRYFLEFIGFTIEIAWFFCLLLHLEQSQLMLRMKYSRAENQYD